MKTHVIDVNNNINYTSATFSRCTNNTITTSYYTKAFGATQGTDASTDGADVITGNLNWSNPVSGNTWEVNEGGNVAYLSTFNKKVDVTGWISGSTAGTSSSNPYLDIFGGNGVTYEYKDYTAADGTYTTTAPTSAGHYYVRATDPFGFRNIKDFYVYNPPTPNKSLTYNGTDQDLLTVPTIDKGSYMFKIVDGAGWGASTPKGQAARTYTINYYIRSSESNYKDIGSQESPIGSFEVTIAPKPLGSDAIVLGESTYIYDGTEKKPSVTVKDGNTTINSDFYNVSYSNHINAGTATVTVTDKDGGNYDVRGTQTFTINPKTVSNPTITLSETSYVYDAKEHKPSVTVYDGSDLITSSEYTVSYSNNVSVGTDAKVTVTDNANGNYTVNGSTAFSITKEQLVVTVTANDLYYDYEEQELVTGSVKGSGTYKPILYSLDNVTYTTDVPKGKKVKTYTVYYKIEGDDNHIGTDVASVDASIKSKKVDNPKIEISPSVCTYDGKPKTPDVRVYDGTTEILSSEFTVSYSNNTNVGTATVTITDVEGGTYTVSGTATFTIVKESTTYTAPTAKTGLTYTGKAQELVSAGSTETGEMQYSLDGKTYSTDIPKGGTDAKTYTVYYKVVGDDNHDDSAPATVEVTISKKTVSKPTITLSASSFVYNGKAQEPTVTVKDGDSEIPASQYTVSYSNNVNVGTATVTIAGKDDGNYILNGSTTFQIVDADSKVTAPTAKTGLTYNGKAQELVTAGSAEGGTLEYSTDGKSYSTSLPTGTDAKTYTVYYRVSGDANHGNVEASSISVTISAKTVDSPTITVSPSSYTYDGSAKTPDVTVKDKETDTVISSDEYTVSYSNNMKVGTATVTIKDNDGGNYIVSGTATFTIKETGSSYTAPTAKTGLTYTGKAQEPRNWFQQAVLKLARCSTALTARPTALISPRALMPILIRSTTRWWVMPTTKTVRQFRSR